MIDWAASNTTAATVKTEDRVWVQCSCGTRTTVLYRVARRHIQQRGAYYCHPCIVHSPEFKQGCAARAVAKWQDPQYRRRNLAACTNPDERAARRSRALALWASADYRRKHAAAVSSAMRKLAPLLAATTKRLWQDQEYRAKNRAGQAAYWADPAVKQRHSATVAALKQVLAGVIGEQSRARWLQPEYRARLTAAITATMNRPEITQLIAQRSSARWQNQEYAARFQTKEFAEAVRIAMNREEVRIKLAIVRASQPRISAIQQLLYKHLDDLGVAYHQEGTDTALGFYAFDCLVPGDQGRKHLLIECQGEYWHSLPQAAARDRAKFTYVDRYFPEYEVMYLWEHEFYSPGRVPGRLRAKLGLTQTIRQFAFQDVLVREIEQANQVREFLDAYHYIGKGRGGKSYGAYLDQQLIAVAVCSPPLRQNSLPAVELSRLCIHPEYQPPNFASWFLARVLARIPGNVVAFADTTAGHQGTVYKAAGFRLHHETVPDYWYRSADGYVMHKRTLYGRASRLGVTEAEYATRFGYHKQWGGKKLCYLLERP